jgi:hypothetical protein
VRHDALVRYALPAGMLPDDAISAKLCLKKKGGDAPTVIAGYAAASWASALVDWDTLSGSAIFPGDAKVCESAEDDWYEIEATDIVKGWLSGAYDNYGFVITETQAGKATKFESADADDQADCPRLEIRYRANSEKKKYGKFSYTAQDEKSGNCMAYALRDLDNIFLEDMGGTPKILWEKKRSGGMDAALLYLKDNVLSYIDAHQEALQITSWRELSGAGDKIDPQQEYLIEMKLGFEDGTDEDGYDYHFRVRLADGSWAEKITNTATRIVPGSNASFDTGKFAWDSNYEWGQFMWNGFYNSKAIYIAITKSTDDFTKHKSA